MALTRRSVQRMSGSIWPGFVDAMTALLLVLMFVLTIFMVVQYVLRETITGQESELNQLSSELNALAQAALHADEIPGLLVLHHLQRLLDQASVAGAIDGEVVIVPLANHAGVAFLTVIPHWGL